MVYAIIKVVNGTYAVHAEGFTDLNSAKVSFHGLCQALWNAPDVLAGISSLSYLFITVLCINILEIAKFIRFSIKSCISSIFILSL